MICRQTANPSIGRWLDEGRGGLRATMAMAPRASGLVGHVSHAVRAAARLARGMNWLETEGRASLMRSRRAVGPARAPLFDTFGEVFSLALSAD